jgi:hypothetical protein
MVSAGQPRRHRDLVHERDDRRLERGCASGTSERADDDAARDPVGLDQRHRCVELLASDQQHRAGVKRVEPAAEGRAAGQSIESDTAGAAVEMPARSGEVRATTPQGLRFTV